MEGDNYTKACEKTLRAQQNAEQSIVDKGACSSGSLLMMERPTSSTRRVCALTNCP
jgi:hypothetical protein